MRLSQLSIALLAGLLLGVGSAAFATIINVPGDFGTIQAAISDGGTTNGDTVQVAAGTYNENIDYSGKNLILIGDPANPGNIIIDAEGDGRVVHFHSGETATAQLIGFTLQNGDALDNDYHNGGGIFCESASPTLSHLIIRNSHALFGGGLSLHGSNPALDHIQFYGNGADGGGGGIDAALNSNPVIEHVTFSGNTAGAGGAIWVYNQSHPLVRNSILWDNSPQEIAFPDDVDPQYITIAYTDIEGGLNGILTHGNGQVFWGDGNIDADPEFSDPDNDDYHLTLGSPCINAGDAGSPIDPDGTRNDMGALYFSLLMTESFGYPDGWALMSLPLIPVEDSVQYVVGDDLEQRWVVYGFEPDQGFFVADTMAHGKGYFLCFDEFDPPNDITIDVTGVPMTDDSVSVDLVWGWNIIATPFRSTSPLEDATFWFNDTAYSYAEAVDGLLIHPVGFSFTNTGFIIDDELDPWRAYWFLTLVDGIQSVTLYPTLPHPMPRQDGADEGTPSNWSVDLSGTVGLFTDSARLGVRANAHDGFDNAYDYAEPPTPPTEQYARLYFANPRWNSPVGEMFERDIRSPIAQGESAEWTLTAVTAQPGDVRLSWNDLAETTPWRNSYVLVDNVTGSEVDMRAQSIFDYRSAGTRQFTVRVQSSLDVSPAEPVLPSRFGIASVSPNPFNNRSLVAFDLPSAGNVKLTVTDIVGRSVATMAEARFTAGRHVVAFSGEGLAGGNYILRLESSGAVSTANMTLVK